MKEEPLGMPLLQGGPSKRSEQPYTLSPNPFEGQVLGTPVMHQARVSPNWGPVGRNPEP